MTKNQRGHSVHSLFVSGLAAGLMFAAGSVEQASASAFTAGNLAVFSADVATSNNTTFSIVELLPTTNVTPVQTISINGTTGPSALRSSGSATSTGYLQRSNDGTLLSFTGHNSTTATGNANTILARGVGTLDQFGAFSLATTYTGVSAQQTRSATSLDNTNWYIGDQAGQYTNGAIAASPAANLRGVKSFGGAVYALQQSTVVTNIVVSTLTATSGGSIVGLPGLANNSTAQDFYMISSGLNGSVFDVLYISNNSGATVGSIAKFSLVGSSWVANGVSASTGFGGFGLAAAANGTGADLFLTSGNGATAANTVRKLVDANGWNAAISLGSATTVYTAPAGTTLKGIDFTPVPAPGAVALLGLGGLAASRRRRA